MPQDFASKLTAELIGLLVVATIMESALSTLFDWRLYKEFFNGRAVKTLVMIGFGLAVVTAFNYDIFERVLRIVGGTSSDPVLSGFLSALVLAGGSAAVYRLFTNLGLRAPAEPTPSVPQPPENRAWFSVKVIPETPFEEVVVNYARLKSPTEQQLAALPVAGTLRPPATVLERVGRIFFADPARFPAYGGISVEAGDAVYEITVTIKQASEKDRSTESVYVGRFANRAVVDFVHRVRRA